MSTQMHLLDTDAPELLALGNMLLGHVEKHQLPGYIREYAAKLVSIDNS